jgi:hypothetical protein
MNKHKLEIYISQGLSQHKMAKLENCSQSKIRRWLNKFNLPTKRTKKIKRCLYCSNILDKYQRKFCDASCQMKYQAGTYIARWKAGKETGTVSINSIPAISQYIRTYLFDKYNSKCAQCGWAMINEFTKCIPLEVEHIDGNYRNNKENNLTLLCPNCHSLTATYKRNKGFGRNNRKRYYEKTLV